METESSVLPTIDVEDKDQIVYASHVHPLTLCDFLYNVYCSMCGEPCLDQRTYGCNQCGLFLHESCTKIEIPQEIDHYFHPHPLSLAMNECDPLDYKCLACGDSLPGLIFECRDCKFYMDVICALLPTKLKQDECTIDHILNFQHPHPLILCDNQMKYFFYEIECSGCGGGLSTRPCFSYDDTSLLLEGSESVYRCLHSRCRFYLHELCARLPPKIDSPFHPDHSLQLKNWLYHWSDHCRGCDRDAVNHCSYECPDSCQFVLGVECAFLPAAPNIKLESHNHLLTLFPSINPTLCCQICNEACDSSNIFRCIDCDYNLHLLCGPLPCSIKHKCHIDPLKLMDAFVEDGYEDDIVYCDACEQPRDPDQCVYYCKDCNFIAEFKCVEAEVLRSLNGERGNVKLRTANKTRIRVGAKLISYVTTDNVEADGSDSETEHIGAKYLEVELHENLFSGGYTADEYEQLIEIFNKADVKLGPLSIELSMESMEGNNKALCADIEQYKLALAKLQPKEKQELLDEESDNGEKAIAEPYSDDYEESDNGEKAIAEPYSDDYEESKSSDNGENAIAEPYSDDYKESESSDNGENEIAEPYSADYDFKEFMRALDSKYESELLDMFFRRDYNIVRIGEHVIVQDSASVLKGLLHEYGDFTAESKLSERLKAIFLTLFCQVIRSMCVTNVREVDFEELQKWWKSLKLVQHAGFEIEFAIDQLYNVVQASFGMQTITSYRETKSQVDEISNEIEEKEAKLEAMKRELEVKKRELEELKSDVDKRKYGIEYESCPVLRKCLKQVSDLKWKKAWDGSPIMFC